MNKIRDLSNKAIHCLSGNKQEHDELDKNISLSFQNRLISHGFNGASINGIQISAPKIKLVNTNGAGDSLIGAYIALEEEIGQEKALEEAVNYSSKVCSVNGPRLR